MPTLSIELDKATIASGDEVTITVDVENFELQDPDGHDHDDHGDPGDTEFRAGYDGACQGHYHVYLDELDNPMIPILAQDHRETTTVTVEAEPGEHEILVRLNDDHHKIIEPQVVDSASLTVQ